MRIVVVGYGPGGAAAAHAARMLSPESEVTVLTEEKIESHRRPGISLALESPRSNLFIPEWSTDSLSKRRIDVRMGVSVVGGDAASEYLEVRDSKGRQSRVQFDRLILATGGKPVVPEIPGVNIAGVFTIQNLADARRISESLASAKSVAIVGAGFSGLETAERLLRLRKEVHLVVRSRVLRRLLEEPMSEELVARMPHDIKWHMSKSPQSIAGRDRVTGLVIGNETISTDAVMFMTGVVPNIDLARKLGLAIGPLGGVAVDLKMESSIPGVFAVGDCVEMKDTLTGKPILMPVGSAAARAGRQAGASAVGKEKIYPDVFLRLQYDKLFGVDIVCVGHSSVTAADAGVDTRVRYWDDPAECLKAALVTTDDGRLIGGQVLTSRMGSMVGYQIMERIQSGAILDEQPLLKSRHERGKEFLESRLGPIV
jgi:NADH oxidase (H2O2-forming)